MKKGRLTHAESANLFIEGMKGNGNLEFIRNLYCRWLDEKDYEPISDYITAIQNKFGYFVKITKTFRITIQLPTYDLIICFKRNRNNLEIHFSVK